MNANILLGITIACFVFPFVTQMVYYKLKRKQKVNLTPDWEQFLIEAKNKHIDGIIKYADKLIWNKYIDQNQIDTVNAVLLQHLSKRKEIRELYAINKNKREYLASEDGDIEDEDILDYPLIKK